MSHLEPLRRQHHALLPPYLLKLPTAEVLASEESQQYLIQHILHDKLIASYTAERGYERTFWRKIVAELEKGVAFIQAGDPDSELEVDEVFYEHLAEVMVSSPGSSDLPGKSYRTFIYDSPAWSGQPRQSRVTLLEEQVAIQAGTTGLRTWTASLHLAHHILKTPQILLADPKTETHSSVSLPQIIELGAGTGFLSILLSQLGADVIATDLDDADGGDKQAPLNRLRGNVELNDSPLPVNVEALDWADAALPDAERPAIWHKLAETPRTVVAADVIYDPSIVPLLVNTISLLLASDPPSIAIISATVRNPATLDLFVDTCISSGLQVEVLNLEPMDASAPTFWDSALDAGSRVRIMRITPM